MMILTRGFYGPLSAAVLCCLLAVPASADQKSECRKMLGGQASAAACTSLIDGGSLKGPALAEIYLMRARVYQVMKQYRPALADLDKAIALDPHHGRYYVVRAMVKLKLGDTAGATADKREVEKYPY